MATTAVPASSQKNVQIIHPTRTKAKSDAPLDFSFLNITSPKGKLQIQYCPVVIYVRVKKK